MANKYLDDNGLLYFWQQLKSMLAGKVDKVTGKGLSTNDYTTADVTKLSGIETGAEVNVIESILVNGTAATIASKAASISVPTKTSDITNDSGYITINDVPPGSVASTTTPKMDGTASTGSENAFARGDHVHPTDTSLQTKITASGILKGGGSGTVTAAVAGTDYQAPLPTQTGNSGKYLTTDGTDLSWAAVDALPSQTDNSGKFLTTDGTDASWVSITQDDHKWLDVALTKSEFTPTNTTVYVPYVAGTSSTSATLIRAEATTANTAANAIARYNADRYLISRTPTSTDSSTKVATTAFVGTAISGLSIPSATSDLTNDSGYITSADVPSGSSTTPAMDGTAAAGTATTWAHGDHVHPTDTTRQAKITASGILKGDGVGGVTAATSGTDYAAASHTHGEITSGGDITTNATIASGDRLVINDESASKIKNSSITFGTSTSTFLANNGTWATPSGAVTSVNTKTGAVVLATSDLSNDSGYITQTYADTTYAAKSDISGVYKYKGSVSTYADLPSTGLTAGDVYNVEADGMNYAWTGSAWDALGSTFTITSISNAEIDVIVAS